MTIGDSSPPRLGFSPEDRVLVIHADDAGLAHAVNWAILNLLDAGAVTSASAMVPCPWFAAFADAVSYRADLDIGIHLTLTSEWEQYRWGPISSRRDVPTLVDDYGYLLRSKEAAARKIDPAQARVELRAQIDRSLSLGLRPSHLDSHMGVLFLTEGLFQVYVELGIEYGLPIFVPREGLAARAPEVLDRLDETLPPLVDRMIMARPPTAPADLEDFYFRAVSGLRPGVSQLIVHPAQNSPEMAGIAAGQARFGAEWRTRDLEIMASESFKDHVRDAGVRLTTWRELQARLETGRKVTQPSRAPSRG